MLVSWLRHIFKPSTTALNKVQDLESLLKSYTNTHMLSNTQPNWLLIVPLTSEGVLGNRSICPPSSRPLIVMTDLSHRRGDAGPVICVTSWLQGAGSRRSAAVGSGEQVSLGQRAQWKGQISLYIPEHTWTELWSSEDRPTFSGSLFQMCGAYFWGQKTDLSQTIWEVWTVQNAADKSFKSHLRAKHWMCGCSPWSWNISHLWSAKTRTKQDTELLFSVWIRA